MIWVLALLLIGYVILGLSLYLSEALLSHTSNRQVSACVASEGLSDLSDNIDLFSKTKMHTHDLTMDFFVPAFPAYLFEKPDMKHKIENSNQLLSTLLAFIFRDREVRLLTSGNRGSASWVLCIPAQHLCTFCLCSLGMLSPVLSTQQNPTLQGLVQKVFPSGLSEIHRMFCLNHSFVTSHIVTPR